MNTLPSLSTVTPSGQSVHHLHPVLVDRRDELIVHLERRGITTLVHYPVPLHLQPCYRSWGLPAETFPVAERAATRLLSLPLFPQLTDEEALTVCSAIREFYA